MYLSGLGSPDVNMALVHGSDPRELHDVVSAIEQIAAPALLFLTADGLETAENLGAAWSHVGAMPFMIAEVDSTPQQADGRVRRATAEDRDAVLGLWVDAFGVKSEYFGPLVDATVSDAGGNIAAWLLEDNGEAVSTLTTGRADDALTLWCMATPERFGRRGFGRALLADTMARAASEGAEVGLLGASPAGKPLYEATGWSTLENWETYTNGASAQFH
jgi:GNAT superfamily N-acetyltransferase